MRIKSTPWVFVVGWVWVAGSSFASANNPLFSEAYRLQPTIAVVQSHEKLKPLFCKTGGQKGESLLCGPTTLANVFAWQKQRDPDPLTELALTVEPTDPEYVKQVITFTSGCQTDVNGGTSVTNMKKCTEQLYEISGYKPMVKLIGPSSETQDTKHAVSFNDIRDGFKNGAGLVLQIGWYTFNVGKSAWESTGGHYVWVVGYEWDETFGDTSLLLKIIDPSIDYSGRKASEKYDPVTLLKVPRRQGATLPDQSDYLVQGSGIYNGESKRAFIRNLLVLNGK